MIIDSSAILAILFGEPDAPAYARAIVAAEVRRISAANWLETAIRIDSGAGAIASNAFDDLIREASIEVMPVTHEQARIARSAYRAYGKGSGHPAQLNFGDCFAYGLAKVTGEPLLFKGTDFSETDIQRGMQDFPSSTGNL
ncbi:MAG TPA: type II toxin-antitoxin system VapC family toxin [Thermoanaerobaculia bacterium]|nr:type II toxin-antitoxin system VapC family toxin [Thermoanaerobaculia bacterium]